MRTAEQRRLHIDIEHHLAIEQMLQQGLDSRIACDHVARDPTEQHGAEPDQQRKAVEHQHDQRGSRDDHGNADGKAEDQKGKLPVGGSGHRDHIVEAHHDVGDHDDADRMPQRSAGGNFVALVFRHEKLGRDDQQRNSTRQLQVGQRHQRHDDAGERDQEHHGDAGADRHAPQAMPAVQAAAGHRDDERVVAGQQHVDPDDLANRKPERRPLNVGVKLREERADIGGIGDLQQQIHGLAPCPSGSRQPVSISRRFRYPRKIARSRPRRSRAHPTRAPSFRRSTWRKVCGSCHQPPWRDRWRP